jgi:hypothetical protein
VPAKRERFGSGDPPQSNASRGDRRLTFLNDRAGMDVLWLAVSQSIGFSADTFFAAAEHNASDLPLS